MSDNNCYLFQEHKSVVGHATQFCPNVKCEKCGQKGHDLRNCPNLYINKVYMNMFEKGLKNMAGMKHKRKLKMPKSSEFHCDICDVIATDQTGLDMHMAGKKHFKMKSKLLKGRPNVAPNDKEMMDFIHDIEFSDDIKPKLEIKEEPINMKSTFDSIKMKSVFKEETLKVKSLKIDQRHDVVPKDKEMIDFVDDIEFLNCIKKEIKEEPIDVKSRFEHIKPKLEAKEDMLNGRNFGTNQNNDFIVPKDKEIIGFVDNIEFSDDIKKEIKEEQIDMKSSFDSIKIESGVQEEISYPNVICQDWRSKRAFSNLS